MTPSCEAEKENQGYFNSPPHKENHIATTMINTIFFKISTHILTKRMTQHHLLQQIVNTYFNSHPHEEDDPMNFPLSSIGNIFQLTSSRRGWQLFYEYFSIFIIFQLTSSRRGWLIPISFDDSGIPFQLTSSRRGWRKAAEFIEKYFRISTHILTKRMTIDYMIQCLKVAFQLTSSRRGWPFL